MKTASMPSLTHWMTRGRRACRAFDARLATERRLIVIAVACVTWYALDALWVTPAYQAFQKVWGEQRQAKQERQQLQGQLTQLKSDMATQQRELQAEVDRLKARLAQQDAEVQRTQSQLVPARELREVLETMLARHGQLRLRSMKTVPPTEVRLGSGSGRPLFKHGLELTVEGGFHDLLGWLQAIEAMPRRLIWNTLKLATDEQGRLSLSLQVYTLSPDRDALEMAP